MRRTRVDAEHSQHREAPAISLLAGILFFSGVLVTRARLCLYVPIVLPFLSAHELLNACVVYK
jgi:hypothetical protein